VAFAAFIMMLIYYHPPVDIILLLILWPLGIIWTLIATVGIGCWLSALNVKYRDFRYIVPFALQIALFVSPVLYPVSIVKSEWINYVLALNPMHGAISIFRMPMVEGSSDTLLLLISAFSTVLFLVMGISYFKKTEASFADIV
jgi:lipopolysaccharide transport system permease protein